MTRQLECSSSSNLKIIFKCLEEDVLEQCKSSSGARIVKQPGLVALGLFRIIIQRKIRNNSFNKKGKKS